MPWSLTLTVGRPAGGVTASPSGLSRTFGASFAESSLKTTSWLEPAAVPSLAAVEFDRLRTGGVGVFQGLAGLAVHGHVGHLDDLAGADDVAVAFGDFLHRGLGDFQRFGELQAGGLLVAVVGNLQGVELSHIAGGLAARFRSRRLTPSAGGEQQEARDQYC